MIDQRFVRLSGNDEIPDNRLRACYQFFPVYRLEQLTAAQLELIHLAVVDRLSLVVSITCDEYDNPHLIFESLQCQKGKSLRPPI